MIKKDCFAYIEYKKDCNALLELDCTHCRFYKKRKEVKNNPFYEWSYKNKEKYLADKRNLRLKEKKDEKV